MKRIPTLLLGLVTLLPALALAVSAFEFLERVAEFSSNSAQGAESVGAAFLSFARPLLASVFLALPLLTFYVWHVLRRARLRGWLLKTIWIVFLVHAWPVSMPIYWYAHVFAPLPEAEPRPASRGVSGRTGARSTVVNAPPRRLVSGARRSPGRRSSRSL